MAKKVVSVADIFAPRAPETIAEEPVQEMIASTEETAEEIAEAVAAPVETAAEEAVEQAEEITEAVTAPVETVVEETAEQAEDIAEAVAAPVETVAEEVEEPAPEKVKENISEPVQEKVEEKRPEQPAESKKAEPEKVIRQTRDTDAIFAKAEKPAEKKPEVNPGKKKFPWKKVLGKTAVILACVLIFTLFLGFLMKQYSFAHLTHDDYGYATLSYVYWEEGMWGQDFSMEQLVHYLTQHYNRWGGRVLSFGQAILLMQQGTAVIQTFHACVITAILLLAFLFAVNSTRLKNKPVLAAMACLMFGLIGRGMAVDGLYWYSASILYVVPVIYIFTGAWLVWLMMFDTRQWALSLSKFMMMPFACVLFFFGGFSMEQVGIGAVVVAGSLLVLATFYRRNLLVLLYGIPPFLSSIVGCHIMLLAVGNNTRRSLYAAYYALPFKEQIRTSAQTIINTLFSTNNFSFILLMAATGVLASLLIIRRRKNVFTFTLAGVHGIMASLALVVARRNVRYEWVVKYMWIYLVFMAIVITVWLLGSGKKQDYLIWAVFFGGLASQGGCLIAPIYPARCALCFFFPLCAVALRGLAEVLQAFEGRPKSHQIAVACAMLIPVMVFSSFAAGEIFVGFRKNERVNEYNERVLRFTGMKNDELGIDTANMTLMHLQDESYSGSTQPYGRDLIKDWMKIYYKLPDHFGYGDFIYEPFDEERLTELEGILAEEEQEIKDAYGICVDDFGFRD